MEEISQAQGFVVKQQVNVIEAVSDYEAANRYEVYDSDGKMMFYALETTGWCSRHCCRGDRGFTIKFVPAAGGPAFAELRASKNYCGQTVRMEAPIGTPYGKVVKPYSFCTPTFNLKDADGTTLFRIEVPCVAVICKIADQELPVLGMDGKQVGQITKKCSNLLQAVFTDAETFGVTFNPDADIKPSAKALVLAAVFPIDFALFEG